MFFHNRKVKILKKASIILLLTTFLAFLCYEFSRNADFEVIKIISPTEIVVDLNKNGIADDDENICIKGVESFSTKQSEQQRRLAKKLKISDESAIGLGFLAQEFAKSQLLQKNISLEFSKPPCSSCTPAEIFTDGKNYQSILLSSGLAVSHGVDNKILLNKNLEKAEKLNLKIFNNKSHKYHKLTCKYGKMAHNSQIIPQTQLPKDATRCRFCLVDHHKKIRPDKNYYINTANFIPNVKKPPSVFSTNSIKVFLTDLTSVKKPTNNCNTELCKELVQQINSSCDSIDFAIYGYTKIPEIQYALQSAQKRGVKIRFVYDVDGKSQNIYPDTSYLTKIFTNNNADFSHCEGGLKNYQNSIMHNKFFVFDNKKVMTGSANLSNTDYSGFNSNVVILIDSIQIAAVYAQEFEQMYNKNFHNLKTKIADKEHIQVNGSDFSAYFSPCDKAITTQIVPLVDNAKKYIYMPVFLITHKGLADSLVRASKRGVDVKVIIDATNARGSSSKHKLLRDNGVLVKTENYAGKLHSKSIIIDDRYTIIGSMNFSKSGENANDENLVVIKNQQLTVVYRDFFKYLWAKIPDKWLKLNARPESADSIGSCDDGIDNDFDGKIDRLDNSCTGLKK